MLQEVLQPAGKQPLPVVAKNDYMAKADLTLRSMPDRNVHKKISELVLGDPCEDTHAYIDSPVKELGRGHRSLYHDPLSASLIGFIKNGYKGATSGILHIITDRYFNTYLSKEALRFSLKVIEYKGGENRRSFKN